MGKRGGPDIKRLERAIEWSIQQLAKPRKDRVQAIRQYVGSHYGEGGADHRVPTNLLELAVTIYVRNLAARAPKVMVSADRDDLRPMARNLELALNQIPREIGLARTLRHAVVEAIFAMGVVKVGISEGGEVFQGHDTGKVFVDLVPFDDYFLDMTAKTRAAIQFEGNDYWLPIDDARAMYDGPESDIEPDPHSVTGEQGENRAEGVSTNEGAEVFGPQVWLRDIWLPPTNEMITLGVKNKKVFRIVPWDGPEHGPYHTLSFNDVPGNLLPLPPVALWIDLHELANTVFRKLARQAEAKKTIAAFPGGNENDVDALKRATDGEGIRYAGAKPEAITVGGIDAPSLAFYLQTRDLFSYFAGNLDMLGGLSPMSETATQDKLLSEAANARLDWMSRATLEFSEAIFQSLAWYEWTDPVRTRRIRKPAPGSDIVMIREWSPETREGDFLDFNLELDVYSMQDDTPALRLQKIGMALERFVIPLMPLIQAQGGQIDFRKLMELVGRLGNVEELNEVVIFGEPLPQPPAQGGSPQPSMRPARTVRTYERVNRPGATRSGKDDVMTRMLMGGGVQKSEAASLMRPTR